MLALIINIPACCVSTVAGVIAAAVIIVVSVAAVGSAFLGWSQGEEKVLLLVQLVWFGLLCVCFL